jgi:hypothetical protein
VFGLSRMKAVPGAPVWDGHDPVFSGDLLEELVALVGTRIQAGSCGQDVSPPEFRCLPALS